MKEVSAFIGLGSNLGNSEQNIKDALSALALVPGIRVVQVSKMYRTKPWGYTEQPDFTNACAKLKVTLSPQALLGACLGIEAAMGRVRTVKNGPRCIDIDVLLYEGVTMDTPELILPHPRMYEREFVTLPLSDLEVDI